MSSTNNYWYVCQLRECDEVRESAAIEPEWEKASSMKAGEPEIAQVRRDVVSLLVVRMNQDS